MSGRDREGNERSRELQYLIPHRPYCAGSRRSARASTPAATSRIQSRSGTAGPCRTRSGSTPTASRSSRTAARRRFHRQGRGRRGLPPRGDRVRQGAHRSRRGRHSRRRAASLGLRPSTLAAAGRACPHRLRPRGRRDDRAAVYDEHFPDGPGYRRALAASFWRVFSPPPRTGRSRCVTSAASATTRARRTSSLRRPDTRRSVRRGRPVEDDHQRLGVRLQPGHEWWDFPDMTRTRSCSSCSTTHHSHAWRVLHSAFRDPTVDASLPRHSIEVRTFAFFQ